VTPEEQIKRLISKVERQEKMIGKLLDALEEVTGGQRWLIPWLDKLLKDAQQASGRGMTYGEMGYIRAKKLAKTRELRRSLKCARNSHPPEAKK
jgi:hypothetical protein